MIPTAPLLRLELDTNRSSVRIQRGAGVSDDPWLQIRAEWGADGRNADRYVDVSIERFMARRNVFAQRCGRLGIGVELDDGVRQLARLAKDTHQQVEQSLSGVELIPPEKIEELLAASRFKRGLRSFQTRDLQKLLALLNGANFSVPGAGKTAVAYALYEVERQRGRVDRLLVIAPMSAFGSWIEEAGLCIDETVKIQRYDGGPIGRDTEILLISYQRLAPNYGLLSKWLRKHRVMVVLDEAHRMKRGWNGEWGTACLNLAYMAERRDILTGTPAPQSPADFVALIDFIWPNEAIRIMPSDAIGSRPPADAGPRVADRIRPLFVRTNKKDLDLPLLTFNPITVPLLGLHQQIYEALRNNYRGSLPMTKRDELGFAAWGTVTMYLLEAATNPKLLSSGWLAGAEPEVFRHPPLEVEPGTPLARLIETYNLHETPLKFIELMRLIKANADQGRKTLVWSNFVRNLITLEKMLARYEPALIYGAVPAFSPDPEVRTRENEVKRFREDQDCLVMLANPAAMSEGISLHHECHDAIYLERTFNAGQYLQSLDRIHRLGLPDWQETRVTFLLTKDTIDEAVDRRLRVKAERLGEMLDDPNLAIVALPDEDDYRPVVDSIDDVAALFAHLRGDDER
jgi:SNF2 family DNA or RNA helicase